MALVLAIASGLIAASPEARSEAPGPDPAVATGTARLDRDIEDLLTILSGDVVRDRAIASLFDLDLTDESAVAARARLLEQRLAASARPPGADGDATGIAALQRRRDQLALAFLSLPKVRRDALLAASGPASAPDGSESRPPAGGLPDDGGPASEEARLRAYRAALDALRETWRQRSLDSAARVGKMLRGYADIGSGRPATTAVADSLYADLSADMRAIASAATQAIDGLDAPSEVPELPAPGNRGLVLFGPDPERGEPLRAMREAASTEAARLRESEEADRYARAALLVDALGTLHDRRQALIPGLSSGLRADVTGLSRPGLERLSSELAHVRLLARWYPIQRLRELTGLAERLKDVFVAGKLSARLLTLIAIVIVYSVVRRRYDPWLASLRGSVLRTIGHRALASRVARLIQVLRAVMPQLLFLGLVHVVFDRWLAPFLDIPEVALARRLVWAWAVYALAVAAIHEVLLAAVRRRRSVDSGLNRKILSSLRVVARFALGIAIYLAVAEALTGHGALYGVAVDIAWVGTVLVGYRLIRAWRDEVTDAYLHLYPSGRLAAAVRATAGKSHGLLLAVAAFVFVAARGLWNWLRDTTLGFEQTRKALAYLLRRRLERAAEHRATGAPDPAALPAVLCEALTEDPAPESLSLDRFAGQAEVVDTALAMTGGARGGLVAIVGERGSGKTTWLQALERRLGEGVTCARLVVGDRVTEVDALLNLLGPALGCPPGLDEQALVAHVLGQPPRVVLVDLAHNLMLRAVGGSAAYEAFVRIARRTAPRVLWVCAFAHWPFEYLERTHPDQDVYDRIIRLPAWSEREIGELIAFRMQRAGFSVDYSEVTVDAVPLAGNGFGSSSGVEPDRPSDRFHRIVWDYADGNPRVALHFWRHSLVLSGERRVTVRLFSIPPVSDLESTALNTRFLLSALVQHENISAAEAARALRYSPEECAATLENLRGRGFLVRENDRYRVTCHWNQAVLLFLRRKKMLVT